MTITAIGIFLIVLCVLLWAIMAALHRHTVQLEALKTQMDALLNATQPRSSRGSEGSVSALADHAEPRAMGEKRA